MLFVQRVALRLAVRAEFATNVRAFVPVEAEPGEVAEDGVLGLLGGALEVGVLDAEDELAAPGAREEVVEERGAGAPDVEVAGGRRREADADRAAADVGGGGGADAGGERAAAQARGGGGREEPDAEPGRRPHERARRHLASPAGGQWIGLQRGGEEKI